MKDFVEYVCIILLDSTYLEDLENHLSMNGYHFGIDKSRNLLFVDVDEVDYVETILENRNINYGVRVY